MVRDRSGVGTVGMAKVKVVGGQALGIEYGWMLVEL